MTTEWEPQGDDSVYVDTGYYVDGYADDETTVWVVVSD